MHIIVTATNALSFKGKSYSCAVGKAGIGKKEREGDNITPIGKFPIHFGFYRPDKITSIVSGIPFLPLSKDIGWCDAPEDEQYNRLVKLPYDTSHEILWRDDDIYDIILAVGYNDDPVVPGKGSAIFIHVAREGFPPTEGCIALKKEDLLEIIPFLEHASCLIVEKPQ